MTDRDVLNRLEDLRHSLYGATIEAAIAEIERIRFDYSTSRQMIDELIRESARLRASPWVSIHDRLPAVSRQVLLRIPAGGGTVVIVVGHRDHDKHGVEPRWFRDLGPLAGVTHWMPIPPLDPTPEQV